MAIDRFAAGAGPVAIAPLSGRARVALQQHQRRVALLQRDLVGVDRVLAGALTACDGASQHEMLGAYLEAVQELRVGLQRLEGFLMQRLGAREVDGVAVDVAARAYEYGTPPAEVAPGD